MTKMTTSEVFRAVEEAEPRYRRDESVADGGRLITYVMRLEHRSGESWTIQKVYRLPGSVWMRALITSTSGRSRRLYDHGGWRMACKEIRARAK